jgi:hypothetical protein
MHMIIMPSFHFRYPAAPPRRQSSVARASGAVLLAVLASWELSIGVLAGAPPAPVAPPADAQAGVVPAAFLARLRAQYISEDARTPNISESDKVRRYESILREGAWAEGQYPKAPNLHHVRELMLAAAKGLATLEGTDDSRGRLMVIARRLAESDAPPEARLPADLLICRTRLDDSADAPSKAAGEIEQFVARYADTPAVPQALMAGVELCRTAGADSLRRKWIRQLNQDHFSVPGVSTFLEAEGVAPFYGRLLSARLTTLDGSVLSLPRDVLGKTTVLHFWSMEKTGFDSRRGVTLKATHERHHRDGLEMIGINLDADRAKVAALLKDKDLPWPQTCSGLGARDPTLRRYGVPTLPAYWVVSPDGRAIASSYHGRFLGKIEDWTTFSQFVEMHHDVLRETRARVPYYRSGEFLLDVPQVFPADGSGAGDVPADAIETIRRKVFAPPSLGLTRERKADVLREVLALGLTAEREHPRAANLTAVRNWMLVAARWLALETREAGAAAREAEIAGRIRAAAGERESGVLARYVCVSGELAARDPSDTTAPQRIDAFRKAYAQTNLTWAADLFASLLAIECGDEDLRVKGVRELHGQSKHPKVRGFLRDVCNANVDASSEKFQHQILSGMAAGSERLTPRPYAVQAALPRLHGGVLRLPQDAGGKLVLLQFWSVACPPQSVPLTFRRKQLPDLNLESEVVHVGVNLDSSRADVVAFLRQNDKVATWIHTFSGKGWDDPLARELDVYGLPRMVLLDRNGTIHCWGAPVQLGSAIPKAAAATASPGGEGATKGAKN